MKLEQFVKRAYKKLKSNVYYDKTALFLRDKIVSFEDSNKDVIEDFIKVLQSEIESGNGSMLQDIINSVGYRKLPKKVTSRNKDNNERFIVNKHNVDDNIDIEYREFIDMDVRGHILGAMWTMMIGAVLDGDEVATSGLYANRLIHDKLKTNSQKLFKPYFTQYTAWRENALTRAKECLNSNNDVLILTMDFKNYYYSVDVNESDFENIRAIVEKDKQYGNFLGDRDLEKTLVCYLNKAVFEIIKRYSDILAASENRVKERNMLPIGFMPSDILANWLLVKFDRAVHERIKPIYYGRYVDDIIIVNKIEKNTALYETLNKDDNSSKVGAIIQSLFMNCAANGSQECINQKRNNLKSSPALLESVEQKDNSQNNDEKEYIIVKKYTSENSEVRLQNKKVKAFYFASGSTNALIDAFQKEIAINASTFFLLPDTETIIDGCDFKEFYKIDIGDSPNKLRDITNFSFDKFGASKAIGKLVTVTNVLSNESKKTYINKMLDLFDPFVLLNNYILWERIFEVLVVNEELKLIASAYYKIKQAILCLSNINNQQDLKLDDLQEWLFISFIRPLALLSAKKIKHVFNELNNQNTFEKDEFAINSRCLAYRQTRMCNKHLMPIPIDLLDDINNLAEVSLFNLDDEIEHINDLYQNLNDNKLDYYNRKNVYLPYLVTPQDISFAIACSMLESNGHGTHACELEKSDTEFEIGHDKLYKIYYFINNFLIKQKDSSNKDDSIVIKISSGQKSYIIVGKEKPKEGKLKVAIGNATIDESHAKNLMIGKAQTDYNKYKELKNLINAAIREKVDLIVLPESYLPFKWVPIITKICAKNQIAIITGIEHYLTKQPKNTGKTVYNLTAVILPYEYEHGKFAHVEFHHKNHFSPNEIALIEGYSHKYCEGNTYELFRWRGVNFPVYCCYEIASIQDRALFAGEADFVVVVEWNKDINYYSNIIRSMSRDLHCYCIQVNSADYGDSRIVQPTKTELADIIKTKGGINTTILVGEIDIAKLRNFQKMSRSGQKDSDDFKQTPPRFDSQSAYDRENGCNLNKSNDFI